MTQQTINIGQADKGNGDPLRTAFGKVNENFTELYDLIGTSENIDLSAVGQHVIPATDSTYDLGSSTKQWRSLYVSTDTIYIDNTPITVSNNALSVGTGENQVTMATLDTTGALQVAGGVGIGGSVTVANNISLSGNIQALSSGPVSTEYRGFYAAVNQISGQDPSINQIVLSTSSGIGLNRSGDTNSDDFFVEDLAGSTTIAVINLYGASRNTPIGLDSISQFLEAYIDLVLYDGTSSRTSVADIQAAFYANETALISSMPAGTLFSNFEFNAIQTVFSTNGLGYTGTGVDAVFRMESNTLGLADLDPSLDYSNNSPLSLVLAGSDYQVDDVIIVPGTQFGGVSPADDMTITVTEVTEQGGIVQFQKSGSMSQESYSQCFVKYYIEDGRDDVYDRGNFLGTDRSLCEFVATTNGDGELVVSSIITGSLKPFYACVKVGDRASNERKIFWQKSGDPGGTGTYIGGFDSNEPEATYTANGIDYSINAVSTGTGYWGDGSSYGGMLSTSTGIFSIVAVDSDVNNFSYLGETGADGNGAKTLTNDFLFNQSPPVGFVVDNSGWYFKSNGELLLPNNSRLSVSDSAVALGQRAGINQGSYAVAIGRDAGINQGSYAVAIGASAAERNQGSNAVAIGTNAGVDLQQEYAVAIGYQAAGDTHGSTPGRGQGDSAIAIGKQAARNSQGLRAIAIGTQAGYSRQGVDAVAIGTEAAGSDSGSGFYQYVSGGFYDESTDTIPVVMINTADITQNMLISGVNEIAADTRVISVVDSTTLLISQEFLSVPTQGYLLFQSVGGEAVVSIGKQAGYSGQGNSAVAVGAFAGNTAQGIYAVAVGIEAGNINQGAESVAIGIEAGNATQGVNAVAVGAGAGNNTQGANAVAVGRFAGRNNQSDAAVAIGEGAGNANQGDSAVTIGKYSGQQQQGISAVAIGDSAGQRQQGTIAVAIGQYAGYEQQGNSAVAIGEGAARNFQGANSIAIGTNAALGDLIVYTEYVSGGVVDYYQLVVTGTTDVTANMKIIGTGFDSGQYVVSVIDATTLEISAPADSTPEGQIILSSGQHSNAVAVGAFAGDNTQGASAVAIGVYAGQNTQGASAVAIGEGAGQYVQGNNSVAVGVYAGQNTQGASAVAIGEGAGQYVQGNNSVAVGVEAGRDDQGYAAVAIGDNAGANNQGASAVAIGEGAGWLNQHTGSIVISALGVNLNTVNTGTFIAPIRADASIEATTHAIYYNPATKELTTSTSIDLAKLKEIVAAATDFADFQTRIGNL